MKKWGFFGGLLLVAVILLRPQAAVQGAQQAMRVWVGSVAPALFPFLVLMPLLTGPEACGMYEKLFAPVMRPLFRLPGSAAPAMLAGMISGSPGGATALAQIAAQSGMRRSELRRLAPVVCGVGPAYLIMGVGLGLFGSRRMGARLALAQLLAQLILLIALRFAPDTDPQPVSTPPRRESRPIRDAVGAVLAVCGYMVFFGAVASALASILGDAAGRALLILADLPSGMAVLASRSFPGRKLVVGMAVGFGGCCIAAQNMDVLAPLGVTWRRFLPVKLAQSALTGLLACLLLPDPAQPAQTVLPARPAYALSLLAALMLCLPALAHLSKKLFLNKVS